MTARATNPIDWSITLQGLSRGYNGTILFKDLSLTIRPGSLTRISGPNGSGKTQLMMAVAGFVRLDAGSMRLHRGSETLTLDKLDPFSLGALVQYVPSFPGVISELPVSHALLAIGHRLRPFALQKQHVAADVILRELTSDIQDICCEGFNPKRPLGNYSMGQQKRLMVASSGTAQPMPLLLMLDEPLAGLAPDGVRKTIEFIKRLHLLGVALLITEHRTEIDEIAFDDQIALPMGLNNAGPVNAPIQIGHCSSRITEGEPVLTVANINAGYPRAHVVCAQLTLLPGEIGVLTGPNGSGKTGFVRALLGFPGTEVEGHLIYKGRTVDTLRGPLRSGSVRYASQKRTVFPDLSVRETIKVVGHGYDSLLSDEIAEIVRRLGPSTLVKHLSSGELSLLAVAQALAGSPTLLILDEPTANLDNENTKQIWTLIRLARDRGKTATLVVEHDVEHSIADKVYEIKINGSGREQGTAEHHAGGVLSLAAVGVLRGNRFGTRNRLAVVRFVVDAKLYRLCTDRGDAGSFHHLADAAIVFSGNPQSGIPVGAEATGRGGAGGRENGFRRRNDVGSQRGATIIGATRQRPAV